MPASYNLTWDPTNRRWRKMHDGRCFVVSCRQLVRQGYLPPDAPQTKEGSYRAANRWWEDRARQIAAPDPYSERAAGAFERRMEATRQDWSRRHGRGYEPDDLTAIRAKISLLEDSGVVFPPDFADEFVARIALGEDELWAERLRRDRPEPAKAGRSVGEWIDKEVDIYVRRRRAGEISPAEVQAARLSLHVFRDWLGKEAAIDAIDAAAWQRWYLHLLGSDLSVQTKTKRLLYSRKFARRLASLGLIPLPPNLDDRYRFKSSVREIPMPDVDEIKKVIARSPGQLKLHLMLMLNCAMTQTDLANLRPSEVDWERGRIRRKRTKTRDRENAPVVEYPLWCETRALLERYGHREGELALLTESGRPWVRDEVDARGMRKKTDAIQSNYAHVKRSLGTKLTMKTLRKAGASMLAGAVNDKGEALYAHLVQRFLGHTPTSIAEKHYVSGRAGQEEFDAAVRWLGRHFGFETRF